MKEKHFIDWFSEHFGYGYGDGEQYILPALKGFFEAVPNDGNYNYQEIEKKIGKAQTWFLMNILCQTRMIEYGTSPRFGWLEPKGRTLKEFLGKRTSDELYTLVMTDDEYIRCSSTGCNCGPKGYEEGKKCDNPLF